MAFDSRVTNACTGELAKLHIANLLEQVGCAQLTVYKCDEQISVQHGAHGTIAHDNALAVFKNDHQVRISDTNRRYVSGFIRDINKLFTAS